ncbi:hypothetical protein [Treponema sp. Marseille-Q3903]|uniref:hypothetical protein n=1 Tax=Treponema sp. Marseille-Q3903 TaxID=2766703 RepID=UPI00351C134D
MAHADTKTEAEKKKEANTDSHSEAGNQQKSEAETNPEKYFNEHIELLVAKIEKVEINPQGDKLYIETMNDGSGTPRIIQSGLRPYLKPEELLGQHVIIAANLAPRKMKGVESHGMLLACDYTEDGKEKVELLTAPWAAPGTQVVLEGNATCAKPSKIDIEHFCKISYKVVAKHATAAGKKLFADGKPITLEKVTDAEIE